MWQPFGAWVPEVESSEFLGVASSHPMPTSCVTKADPDSGHCKEFLSSEKVLQYPKKEIFLILWILFVLNVWTCLRFCPKNWKFPMAQGDLMCFIGQLCVNSAAFARRIQRSMAARDDPWRGPAVALDRSACLVQSFLGGRIFVQN